MLWQFVELTCLNSFLNFIFLCVGWAVFGLYHQDLFSKEVKPILRLDEEKELVWCHREEQRKLNGKNIFETFVKNSFYLLWIRVL